MNFLFLVFCCESGRTNTVARATMSSSMNNNRSTLQESVLVAVTNLMDDTDAIESLITDETNVAMRYRLMIVKRSHGNLVELKYYIPLQKRESAYSCRSYS